MLVGATLEKSEISYWKNKLSNNAWMRVFPNSDGLIPATSDTRFAYAKEKGMKVIFVSSKVDKKYGGTFSAGLAIVKQRLIDLVDTGDFDMIYYTEHHEAEADYGRGSSTGIAEYKTKQRQVFAMVNSITALKRAKIRVGHIMTRQWAEVKSKGNYNYKQYDTGEGDFFGVDMYADSWKPGTTTALTISTMPKPDTWLQYIKRYTYDGLPGSTTTDTRLRCFPELGMIGIPEDTDGSARGNWIKGIHAQLKTWKKADQGWDFIGWIWWNTEGTGGAAFTGIGTHRWFQLDRRHNGATYDGDADGGYVIINNSKALEAWNTIATAEANVTVPGGGGGEPPLPVVTPDPDDDQYKLGYAAGVASVEGQLQTKYDDGYDAGLADGQGDLAEAQAAKYDEGYTAGYTAGVDATTISGRQAYHDEVVAMFNEDLPPVNPAEA